MAAVGIGEQSKSEEARLFWDKGSFVDESLEKQIVATMINLDGYFDLGMGELQQDIFTITGNALWADIYRVLGELWEKGQKPSQDSVYTLLDPKVKEEFQSSWRYDIGGNTELLYGEEVFVLGIDRLKELAACRRLYSAMMNSAQLAKKGKLKNALFVAQDELFAIETGKKDVPKIISPDQHADKMFELLIDRKEKKNNGGIYTRFKRLNQSVNGGFGRGDLIIVAAPTGKGKTALALNLVESFAMTQKQVTLYINTEMSDEQIASRWMTIAAKDPAVTHKKVAMGTLSEVEEKSVWNALEKMKHSEFYSVTEPDLTMTKLESIIRRFKSQKDLRVAVVDYVGRMDTQDKKLQEWQVMSQITKRLKTIAQIQDITVIMLAQLNHEGFLKGAKNMEDECDLLLRLEYPVSGTKDGEKKIAKLEAVDANMEIVIQKNRNGPTGAIPAEFIGERMTFEERGLNLDGGNQIQPGSNQASKAQGKDRQMGFDFKDE
jgi:Replicative DNA helicase